MQFVILLVSVLIKEQLFEGMRSVPPRGSGWVRFRTRSLGKNHLGGTDLIASQNSPTGRPFFLRLPLEVHPATRLCEWPANPHITFP